MARRKPRGPKARSPALGKLIAKLEKLQQNKVQIGYFKEQKEHSTAKMPYAELMNTHEVGWDPNRPVMFLTTQAIIAGAKTDYGDMLRSLIKSKMTINQLLNEMGSDGVQKAHEIFGNSLALEVTSNPTPLVDTEELRDNFAYRTSLSKKIKLLK